MLISGTVYQNCISKTKKYKNIKLSQVNVLTVCTQPYIIKDKPKTWSYQVTHNFLIKVTRISSENQRLLKIKLF